MNAKRREYSYVDLSTSGGRCICHHAFKEDEQLNELEEKLYNLLATCPEELFPDLEQAVNEYKASVIRIAYLQGLKDFAELYITLKKDIHEILQHCP
ncbi:MAG: hypothetical protein IKA09_04705 [Lachnospiraceae bacterium]|nr:hypothetical protein [Lachnospiraceae bacterium]